MTFQLHFAHFYGLLVPLFFGLAYWVLYKRPDERSTSYMPDFSVVFRAAGALIAFLVVVCLLLLVNLFLGAK